MLKTKRGVLVLNYFSDYCCCDISIITTQERFSGKNSVEVLTEFYKRTGRRAVIATCFPRYTVKYLRMKNFSSGAFPIIKKVCGAEELQILLGSADFAVSRIESGKTLKLNNLFVIESILSSCLVAVKHENSLFSDEIKEILHALVKPKKKYCESDFVSVYREHESIH